MLSFRIGSEPQAVLQALPAVVLTGAADPSHYTHVAPQHDDLCVMGCPSRNVKDCKISGFMSVTELFLLL